MFRFSDESFLMTSLVAPVMKGMPVTELLWGKGTVCGPTVLTRFQNNVIFAQFLGFNNIELTVFGVLPRRQLAVGMSTLSARTAPAACPSGAGLLSFIGCKQL